MTATTEIPVTGSLGAELALHPQAQDLLFRSARTANRFTGDPVDDDVMRGVYDLVKWAPTAMNTQPLRVVMVRTTQARETLVSLMAEGNQDKTRSAPAVAILAADTGFHEHLDTLLPYSPGASARFAEPAARERAARFNATLQAGYFLLGVRAAGLAAGPMGGFDHDGVDRAFFPDGRLRSLLVVNIGRPAPDAWRQRLPRLPYEDVVTAV